MGLQSVIRFCVIAGLVVLVTGCYRAPGTARDQLIFISEEKEIALGQEAYRQVLRQSPLNQDSQINEMVHRVGQRIAAAADKPEYQWEFAVIQDDQTVNAFALPGGKVVIYTGILKYTKTDAGLATVMGHEVAHALQRHGAERMSRGILEQIAQLGALAGAATGAVNPQVAMAGMQAYGVGFSLPFDRQQESEADFIGLRLMAKAGYDPHEAVDFWERMSGCPRSMLNKLCFRSQAAVPDFLSTHPSDEQRIRQIEASVPDAMQFYTPAAGAAQSPDRPGPSTEPLPGPVQEPLSRTGLRRQ